MRSNVRNLSYIIPVAAILMVAIACNDLKNNKEMKTEETTPLFPRGNKTPAEWFVGNAYLHIVSERNSNNDFVIGSVTFEPGARTNWHTHPRGQVLIVTEGEGLYQEKGKPASIIKKGDVINIPENTEHWHGATAGSKMVHIAITNFLGESNSTWLKPVSDEAYNEANKQ
ncbi:MAG: cupin domain-containing protein [Chitinophagaceae bacterium]